MENEPVIHLLSEPEAFQDLHTGDIREEYVLDGSNIACHVAGEAMAFPGLTLHLHKSADNQLHHVYLDVMNLRGKDLKQIVAVTGGIEGLDSLKDDDGVLARFEMKPEVVARYVQPGLTGCESLAEFLTLSDDEGMPVFFDFNNYVTEGVLSQ